MITETLLISNILKIKLHALEQDFKNINYCFPNIFEIDDKAFDYEIFYKKVDTIPNIYKIKDGIVTFPFRNSQYVVNRCNDIVIAYAKKQKLSDENAIVRSNKLIEIFAKNDINQKNLIRLIRELIIRKLLEKKYFPLHASCVVTENEAIIYFGKKGSGKSTALFSNVLLTKSVPLSNDITFIGKENNIWKAFGMSYDLTFDQGLFSQIGVNSISVGQYNMISQYNSNKVRYVLTEFCRCFCTSWEWSAPIQSINIVNLSPNNNYVENLNIEGIIALDYLNKYGKDHNFMFDDFLMINGLVPEFNYEELTKEVVFNEIKGNIIEYQLSDKRHKGSIYGRKS